MNKINIPIIIALLLSGLLGFALSLYLHNQDDVILSSSEVQLRETYHYPTHFVQQLNGDRNAGEKIFKEFCSTCHANKPIIDLHAPHIGDRQAWKLREKKGMHKMLKITISGLGAMPARGGCFECSDDQLRDAIKYILHESHR